MRVDSTPVIPDVPTTPPPITTEVDASKITPVAKEHIGFVSSAFQRVMHGIKPITTRVASFAHYVHLSISRLFDAMHPSPKLKVLREICRNLTKTKRTESKNSVITCLRDDAIKTKQQFDKDFPRFTWQLNGKLLYVTNQGDHAEKLQMLKSNFTDVESNMQQLCTQAVLEYNLGRLMFAAIPEGMTPSKSVSGKATVWNIEIKGDIVKITVINPTGLVVNPGVEVERDKYFSHEVMMTKEITISRTDLQEDYFADQSAIPESIIVRDTFTPVRF